MRLPSTLCVLNFTRSVWSHGRVTQITTPDGLIYEAWDPALAETSKPRAPLTAWSASNLGNIYIPPSQFNTSDISCHYNAKPGALHVNTSAGDTLEIQWNEWPTSHVGPVLTYLAACNGSCTDVDKTALQWVKIDELGWLNSTGWDVINLGGTWATNVLIANGFSWVVKIPKTLEGGYYVLRHEIIALHVAEKLNGAQAYPQCFNLRVASTSSDTQIRHGFGTLAKNLYSITDAGILVDVHKKIGGYQIPGPPLWSGATHLKQPTQ
ncbi:lytic polysaccharide monooxygenase [Plenodomus tracheiphilus IPT5]|uniref:Lytic polysaccharide monooxygenase n=1 Tax=Plenodomus tracheiphilus IPT5 TaxID=1408161 RepID=A0A6A7ART7_9PLEO|nr:lytic polysaccharide monooxygenase [Plenodomus tracheiphilus IPT5]